MQLVRGDVVFLAGFAPGGGILEEGGGRVLAAHPLALKIDGIYPFRNLSGKVGCKALL